MDTLYIVMPAYNEEANIKAVIEQWYPLLESMSEDSRLVVADSCSTDRTNEILRRLKSGEYSKIEILSDTNQFHGPKLIALYDYAIKHGADYIFQTDADGQTNPAEFERFWRLREQYDVILGNRTDRGDGKSRAFVERVVCILLRLFFGVSVPDANAPFRLMRASVVEKYLYRLSADYNLPNILLTVFFVKCNEKVEFREISFRPRQAGKNSINIPKIIGIGWKALGDFYIYRKELKGDVE